MPVDLGELTVKRGKHESCAKKAHPSNSYPPGNKAGSLDCSSNSVPLLTALLRAPSRLPSIRTGVSFGES